MGKDFWDDFEDYITNPYHPSRQFEDFEEENKSAEYYFGDESDDEDEDDEPTMTGLMTTNLTTALRSLILRIR